MTEKKIARFPTQLEIRSIQADILARTFEILSGEVGEDKALETIIRTVERDASEAGRTFAVQAPREPGLDHFRTVLSRWSAGNALDIENVRLEGDRLSFTVTRCGYAALYEEMNLPSKLAYALSCHRDASFSLGYHPKMSMKRSRTIMEGAPCCNFEFFWDA